MWKPGRSQSDFGIAIKPSQTWRKTTVVGVMTWWQCLALSALTIIFVDAAVKKINK